MKRIVGLLIILLNACSVLAQDQQVENLQKQFSTYQSFARQEKLFIHTDKTFYLTGETLWFKIYEVDASFHKPFPISSVAYIEILNKDFKPVMQTKVSMKSGTGNGSLMLPGALPSGNYIFRAYTSWMKNFPADYYFEQTIHIVNAQKSITETPSEKRRASISFFPEGGNLIAGLPGKIAFKALDSNGRALDCRGIILNQQNDSVTSFQTLHGGMGSFQFNAEKNAIYYGVIRIGNDTIKQKLPDVEQQGFTMSVSENESGKLKVTVRATANQNNNTVYLLTQTRQVIKNAQKNNLISGEAIFEIDKKDLGEGISGITAFNQLRQPVCERLVFKRPVNTLSLQLTVDQSSYNLRKKVNIELTANNNTHLPAEGNFSMSVFMVDSLQRIPQQNIISNLFLSSDLRGRIESPEYYFQHADKAGDEAVDNLMLTQGWRRFKWDDVQASAKPAFEFLPELEGLVVNGKIVNKITGSPVKESGAFLSIPGADYAFSSATSNADGNVRFAFIDIYKNNVVVVEPSLQKDSINRIDLTNAFSEKFSSRVPAVLSISKNQQDVLISRSIGNQVENIFNADKKRKFLTSTLDTTSFYGTADRLYYLDDYTRFQTMEEVFREYVDDVRIRKDGDKFTFKVRNNLFNTYFEESPLILLDGVPILDATKIVALDPARIKKIEVLSHRYYSGSSAFDGIVNVQSFTGELGATQIDPNALVVEYEGLQQERAFYSPDYSSIDDSKSHMPDFRNVLYWAPKIKTDASGKIRLSFYTSDLKGKYVVVVQGLSVDGEPGKGSAFFEVNDFR